MGTDYKWTAESIVMASPSLATAVLMACDHAEQVPGKDLTPAVVDRLTKLRRELAEALA